METKENEKKNKGLFRRLIFLLIILGFVVIVLMFVLRGKETVSGQYPANVRTSSVVCNIMGVSYPYTDSSDTELKKENSIRIVGTFDNAQALSKIALDYQAFFADNKAAVSGEAVMHSILGRKLADEGLAYSELNNLFSIVDKKVVLSLYAKSENINENNYKYLLLPYATDEKKLSLESFTRHYEADGYKCASTSQQ